MDAQLYFTSLLYSHYILASSLGACCLHETCTLMSLGSVLHTNPLIAMHFVNINLDKSVLISQCFNKLTCHFGGGGGGGSRMTILAKDNQSCKACDFIPSQQT